METRPNCLLFREHTDTLLILPGHSRKLFDAYEGYGKNEGVAYLGNAHKKTPFLS